jgi:hypothetical protein
MPEKQYQYFARIIYILSYQDYKSRSSAEIRAGHDIAEKVKERFDACFAGLSVRIFIGEVVLWAT